MVGSKAHCVCKASRLGMREVGLLCSAVRNDIYIDIYIHIHNYIICNIVCVMQKCTGLGDYASI